MIQSLPRCPVEVGVHLRPFRKISRLDHAPEFFFRDEKIISPVFFSGPGAPRGIGDRVSQVSQRIGDRLAQRGLAGAGGRRDHEHQPFFACYHPSPPKNLCVRVSTWTAERMTWSLSVMMIDLVFRPWVASSSIFRSFASSLSLRIGADSGERTATTFAAITMLP